MVSINVRPGDNGTEALKKLRFDLAKEGYSVKLKELRSNITPSEKRREKGRKRIQKINRARRDRNRANFA